MRTDNSLINSCKFYNVTDEDRVESVKKLFRLDHLNQDGYEYVKKLIRNNADRFKISGEPIEATNLLQNSIHTVDDAPIFSRQYRFLPVHKEEITRQVDELLKNKIINDILDSLGSAKYFSVFDLATGFQHIKMDPKDSHKTAFSTPRNHSEFDRMPFGLTTAAATFLRLMDLTLTGLIGTELFVYLDDSYICKYLEEHEIKFNNLAERLRKANHPLKLDECEFLRPEVRHMGHIIDKNGVRSDPKR